MDDDLLNFVKKLGVPCRHPHDPFFKEANETCQPIKAFGICVYDNEDFHHKPYLPFACHIPNCDRKFETVMQYEAHYKSCHSFTCHECNKNLPNAHLLDLHISENHDSFFFEMAKKKPMFQCLLQECEEVFNNSEERFRHCIEVHKFPSDFRFMLHKKKHKRNKTQGQNVSLRGESIAESKMDISVNQDLKNESSTKKNHKVINFHNVRGRRRPVFYNFSKDLIESLPES